MTRQKTLQFTDFTVKKTGIQMLPRQLATMIFLILILMLMTACGFTKKEETSDPAVSKTEISEPLSEETSEEPKIDSQEESQEADKETEESAQKEESEETAEEAAPYSVRTVFFGSYEQDGDPSNGAEPIEWIVLKEEDGRMLLLSLHALDSLSYHEGLKDTTWEECLLRNTLNETFYNTAFTAEEKEKILKVTNENPDSNGYFNTEYAIETYTKLDYTEEEIRENGALGGNTTDDYVFCLSWEEVLPYLDSQILEGCTPTPYAIAQGAWNGNDEIGAASRWWLRSPGGEQYQVFYMNEEGVLRYIAAGSSGISVRPAIWITE